MSTYNKDNLRTYPVVSKTIGEPNGVTIEMENVIPDDPNYRKFPLTVYVIPHSGRIFLHFSGMTDTHIEIEEQAANGMYVSFVNDKK